MRNGEQVHLFITQNYANSFQFIITLKVNKLSIYMVLYIYILIHCSVMAILYFRGEIICVNKEIKG